MSFSNVPLDSWLLHPGREFEQSKLNNVSYGSQIKDYYAWWIEYDLSGLAENNSYSFRVQLHEEDGDLIQITPIETFQVASNSENYYYSVYELYGNFETNSNNVYLKVFEGDWESGDTTKDSGNLVGVSDVIVFDEYGWVPSDYVSSVETLGLELNNYYYESSSSSDGTNQFFAVLGSQIPGSMYGLSTSPIYGNSVYFFDQEDDSFTLPHQEIYLINNSTYLNSFGSTKTLEVSSDGINWVTDNRNWGNDTIWRSSYRYTVSGTDHSINIFTWDIGKYFRVKYNYFDEAGFPMEVTSDPLQILTSPYSYNYTNIGSAGFSLSGNAEVDKTLTVNQIKNDPDGVDNNNINYKWQSSVDKSSWTDINWVESYLPIISDDEGMYIRSIISYTDSKSNSEQVITSSSSQIPYVNEGEASFSLDGIVKVGNTLKISEDSADPDGGTGTLNYSWQTSLDGSSWNILSSEPTYKISASENGKYIKSILSYQDHQGFSEIVSTLSSQIPHQKLIVSNHQAGQTYHLEYIRDYDGNLHANTSSVSDELKNAYKYQGKLDVNNDGVLEAIYTNKVSGRWAAGKIDSVTGQIDYGDHGKGGGTRVVGIYDDPLIAVGNANGGFLHDGVTPAPAQFGATGSDRYLVVNGETIDRLALNSQVRFQNDLYNDNLTVKTSGDYDGDGYQEVYWKTNDGDVYLRSLMHADGNIQYANYQNQTQMSDYLTGHGYQSVISDII